MREQWTTNLPDELKRTAHSEAGELAWPRDEAIRVIDYLTQEGLRVLGFEVWIPRKNALSIPGYFDNGSASEFVGSVQEHNRISTEAIRKFTWNANHTSVLSEIPYFNLTVDAD